MKKIAGIIFFIILSFTTFCEYSGDIKNGLKDGKGTIIYDNGDKYVGEFKKDLMDGRGTYYFITGAEYIGEFKLNHMNGRGTLKYANGDKYIGEFENDLFSGKGTYYFVNGDKYIGEFKNNLYEGKGKMLFANGDKYEGEFENDKYNGFGTLVSDGIYIGYFKEGEYIGKEEKYNISADEINVEYIFEDSYKRVLKRDELMNLNSEELEIARNEIYARHGHIFKKKKWDDYFSDKSWYIKDKSYRGKLNKIEQKNIELIKEIEKENK